MKALGNDKISEGVVRNSDPLDNSRPYQTGGQLLNSSTTKISQRSRIKTEDIIKKKGSTLTLGIHISSSYYKN